MARKEVSRSAPKAAASPRWNWRGVRPEWVAAALVLVALAWMVTEGEWNFLGTSGRLEGFYEAQAQSLLAGRIDVAPEAIGDEAFVRNGKSYGYFGPTPALFRMPLVILFPGMNGLWSRWSMLAGSALMLWAVLLLLRRLEELMPALAQGRPAFWLRAGLVLAAGIGSTQIFVCAESKVYQESIEWAASLSLASGVCLLSFLMTRRMGWLWGACTTAFLSFFARVSSGAGPIFGLFVLDAAMLLPFARWKAWLGAEEFQERGRAVAALSGTIVLTAALWAGLNYWKFGMFFTSQPLAMQEQYNAARLAHIKGNLASVTNLPLTLSTYLSPANIAFSRGFPWVLTTVIPSETLRARFPSAHFDYCEWFAALPDAMPALFFGALAGTILCLAAWGKALRRLRAPLLGAAAGCGLAFLWGLIAYRYLHDLFPWLVIGAAVAAAAIARIRDARWRTGLTAVFLAATLWSMWANFSFGLLHQRIHTWPIVPEKRMAFLDLMSATAQGGPGSIFAYSGRRREYRSATRVERQQGLAAEASGRGDWLVVRSMGAPPYGAVYTMNAPEDGVYELSIRYASAEPRLVMVTVNGTPIGQACGVATGGESEQYQRWGFAGRHQLRRGPVSIALSATTPFPVVSFLRLTRID